MPAIQTDAAVALAQLKAICAPTTDPVLSDLDLNAILAVVLRGSIWTASAAHSLDDVIMPTEGKRNGHRYRLIRTDGSGILISSATEPNWPRWPQAQITDNRLTWQEDGKEYLSLWDIDYAAYLAWDLKVQRLTDSFDTATGDERYSFSQMIDYCTKARDRRRPIRVA